MQEMQIVVEVSPKPKQWSRFMRFTYVESYWFAPTMTIRNVGDEPLGESNVQRIELVWSFRGGQHTSSRFKLPSKIVPGELVTFRESNMLRVKAPGHVCVVVRLWTLQGAPAPNVRDGDGKPVIVPTQGEWYYDNEDKENYFIRTLQREADDFCSFWAASQTEVKQTLLILIAAFALVANLVISVLRR